MSRYRPPVPPSSPYITEEGFQALREELDGLWQRRREVVVHLSAAAAEGDRSENAEYIYRKKQLRELDRRIGYLQRRLPKLKVVRQAPAEGKIYFGAWVTLMDEHERSTRYRIVGADELDPQRGWIATANHDIRPDGYPYYYSGYFAQSYRYERIRELLSGEARFSVEDHWRFLHDTLNVQARRLTPIFVAALREDERFRRETEILDAWRFDDRADAVGPTLYHALYERLVYRLVEDELGAELANTYIYYRYYWGERLDAMLESDRSTWFDRKDTPQVETRADLIRSAAAEAFAELRSRLGDDVDTWKWGRVHTVVFVSPLREEGFGRDLLGAGAHPLGGSGETVSRARYYFDGSWGFDVVNLSSLRFVADLADDEKAIGVISGGVAARQWHPNQADQVGPWLEGVPLYWWLSDAAVRAHAEHELRLVPR